MDNIFLVFQWISAITKVNFFYSLYCHGSTSENRLSALLVLSEIMDQVTLVMAPILPHLTEEVEIYHPWHSGFETHKCS